MNPPQIPPYPKKFEVVLLYDSFDLLPVFLRSKIIEYHIDNYNERLRLIEYLFKLKFKNLYHHYLTYYHNKLEENKLYYEDKLYKKTNRTANIYLDMLDKANSSHKLELDLLIKKNFFYQKELYEKNNTINNIARKNYSYQKELYEKNNIIKNIERKNDLLLKRIFSYQKKLYEKYNSIKNIARRFDYPNIFPILFITIFVFYYFEINISLICFKSIVTIFHVVFTTFSSILSYFSYLEL